MKLKPKLDCPHCGHKACSIVNYIMLPSWGVTFCRCCKTKLKASSKYVFLSAMTFIGLAVSIGTFAKSIILPLTSVKIVIIITLIILIALELLFDMLWTCFFPLEEIPTYDHSIHHEKEYYEEQRRRSNPDWYDENGNRKK